MAKLGELHRDEFKEVTGKEFHEHEEHETYAVVFHKFPKAKRPVLKAFPETNYQIIEVWDEAGN